MATLMSEFSHMLRSRFKRGLWSVPCVLWLTLAPVEPAAAFEPSPQSSPVSMTNIPTSAVLVEIGGWEVFARRVEVAGAVWRLGDVYARTQQWTWTAEHAEFAIAASGPMNAKWLVARGNIRLLGPDDLYVTADRLTSFDLTRRLVFIEEQAPPSAGKADWRLMAHRIEVALDSERVAFQGLVAVDASSPRADNDM